MEMTEGLLEREGCCLHYWLGGPSEAPLVVFTHGATVDHHEWDATLPLVSEKYRLLVWDVRGHGLSRPAPFNLAQGVDDLLAILDRLQVKEAVFVGHSMGGNGTWTLGTKHANLWAALAPIASGGGGLARQHLADPHQGVHADRADALRRRGPGARARRHVRARRAGLQRLRAHARRRSPGRGQRRRADARARAGRRARDRRRGRAAGREAAGGDDRRGAAPPGPR